jgi:hypothetical protein
MDESNIVEEWGNNTFSYIHIIFIN